jgi:UDP-2,4-diacetamido-2,4,6-trideoxy-beta-L-altropyranose hydrolase
VDLDGSTSPKSLAPNSVVIRVDSSYRIGTGHVSRCLNVAREIRSKGYSVVFVCGRLNGNSSALISEAGFPVHLIDVHIDEQSIPSIESTWSSTTQVFDGVLTISTAEACGAEMVLVDHYGLGLEWEEVVLDHGLEVVALDDLVNRVHAARTVVKPSLAASDLGNPGRGHARELTGPRYFIVPKEYCNVGRNRSSPLQVGPLRVLVFFGGVDKDNATQEVVDALIGSRSSGFEIDVVVGQRNQSAQKLKNRYRDNALVKVYDSMSSLAELMARCDMAIGAGGVTAIERLAACLPSIVFSLAPNQHQVCTQLDGAGLSYYAGEFSAFNSERFVEAFEKFTGSLSQRAQSLKLSRGLIDCLGAKRIAEFLAPSSTSELISRRAVEDDLLTYFGWVNDPIVRSQSLTSRRVELSDHELWFSERLKDPAYRLFVYEVNALPIAQVRFEQIGENWEISYSLDELVRGRGWGVPVIKMAVQSLLVEVNSPLVIAKVKESNTASKKALLNSGFTDTGASNSGGILTLHLNTAKVQPSC